jgi:hypothetical protein
MEETELHGMEWSAQSPDLNRIENVWHKIKHEVQKHVQNITRFSCWKLPFATHRLNYSLIIFKTLINPPTSAKPVIKAMGCITKY